MIGELGVLETEADGATVQCHECGKWYAHLGNHVRVAHGMSATEYKREFGLNESTGLISPSLAEKRRDTSHLAEYRERGRRRWQEMTTEERSATLKGREVRLQHRRDPSFTENLRRANEASVTASTAKGVRNRVTKSCRSCGEEFTVSKKLAGRTTTCSPACRSKLRSLIVSPQSIEALRASNAARKNPPRACEKCGKEGISFYAKTCSKCYHERRKGLDGHGK